MEDVLTLQGDHHKIFCNNFHRCVDEDLKALALGLLSAVAALLGFLPNPLIYGTLIDSSCLVWETSCGETGSCWIYDTTQFRYDAVLLSTVRS